jgi:hypothetical protein
LVTSTWSWGGRPRASVVPILSAESERRERGRAEGTGTQCAGGDPERASGAVPALGSGGRGERSGAADVSGPRYRRPGSGVAAVCGPEVAALDVVLAGASWLRTRL